MKIQTPIPHYLREKLTAILFVLLLITSPLSFALEYPYAPYNEGKLEPQIKGWPLTPEQLTYLSKPFYQRRPGSESGQQKMEFTPYTPHADGSGSPNWYVQTHEKLITVIDQYKKDNGTDIDILLVGDSITWQWIDIRAAYTQYPQQLNPPWKENFGSYKTFNIGVAGDKTQGLLWRLDHGGTQGSEAPGLNPKVVILAIGHNNMFFTKETGIKSAALGIVWSVKNLREKFPNATVIVCKIFPNHTPAAAFYKDAKEINTALDPLLAELNDSKVQLLPDMWGEMTNPDGTVIDKYFRPEEAAQKKAVHLSLEGYQLWAAKLKPLVDDILKK